MTGLFRSVGWFAKIAEPATFSVDRLWVRDKCLFVLDKTNIYRKFKPTIG
ncbi:MAG: hypothetical protein IPN94_26285 [Sphingobacteriales bacterium]|nr:hypothetical protein [Sphingobacteriales bacterium]